MLTRLSDYLLKLENHAGLKNLRRRIKRTDQSKYI